MGGIREQWLFDLNGAWVARYGARVIWLVEPARSNPSGAPRRYEMARPDQELRRVARSRTREVPRLLSNRVSWLDAATREGYWRISIPMVYSAMEAILVPETIGLKAEVVTVRSIAMQVAIGKRFRDPNMTLFGYRVRNELIHGGVTFSFDEKQAEDLRLDRQWWAFDVLKDFLVYIRDNQHGKLIEVMRDLDRSDSMRQVCEWFEQHGGEKLIGEYKKAVA